MLLYKSNSRNYASTVVHLPWLGPVLPGLPWCWLQH